MLFLVLKDHFNNTLCRRFKMGQVVDLSESEGARNKEFYTRVSEPVPEPPIEEITKTIISEKLAKPEEIGQLSEPQKREIVRRKRTKK